MQDLIHLRAGPLTLGVKPSLGASIAYFRHGDAPILRDTPDSAVDGRDFSCFPLIPFSNRIRAAAFSFAGQRHLIARDAEDPRHALHGTSRFMPWQETARTATTLSCTLEVTPQNLDWPFFYQAWQHFELLPDRLRLSLGLRNTHSSAAPFGIGLHPYFFRAPGTVLRFSASYVWAKDGQDIPTHAIPDGGRFNFAHRHAIDGAIDNDYGGFGGAVEITAPGRPRVTLSASPVFTQLVLFTPEGKPYFAAEPVTHRPDGINPNGDALDEGMTILNPGETLEGSVEFMVEPEQSADSVTQL
jgi:aldose 1-epimerase